MRLTIKCLSLKYQTDVKRMRGIVKWFDDKRGYGFITGEDGVDTYVHFTAILGDGYRTLKHNWRVEYEVVEAEDGRPEAREVRALR